jgi:hypothetical protein
MKGDRSSFYFSRTIREAISEFRLLKLILLNAEIKE